MQMEVEETPTVVNDPDVIKELCENNLRLARYMAKKYASQFNWRDVEEFESVAICRLFIAARTYSPDRGAFSTYAGKAIFNAIVSSMRKSPTVVDDVELFRFPQRIEGRLLDLMESEKFEELVAVINYIKALKYPRKAWQVIEMRFMKGLNLREIADALGTTHQAVQITEKKTLAIVREKFSKRFV